MARALRRAVPSPPGEIADLVDLRLEAGRFTAVELARVLLGLLEPQGRDAAWAAITRDVAERHVRLWTDAVQRAPDDLVARARRGARRWPRGWPGHGALAWCAVDRCQAVDPDNTLARLVADMLTHAVSPSAWAQAASMRTPDGSVAVGTARPWTPGPSASRRSCWSSTRPRGP